MDRRKFLKISSISATALVAGSTVYIGISSFDSHVFKMIKSDTAGIKIKDEDIKKFISQGHEHAFWNQFSTVKKLALKIHYYSGGMNWIPGMQKAGQLRSKITGQFLLSTTYFRTQEINNNSVDYISFYNPYLQPCSNPFAAA